MTVQYPVTKSLSMSITKMCVLLQISKSPLPPPTCCQRYLLQLRLNLGHPFHPWFRVRPRLYFTR